MAKKQTFAPPEFQTPFPDHALAEMEADETQVGFWSNWASVGDAKLKLQSLAADIIRADQDWRDCRARAGLARSAGLECGCSHHAKQVEQLLRERNKAKAVVDREIAKFKRGK